MDLIILSDYASPLGRTYVGQVDIVWGPLPTDTLIDLVNPPSRASNIFGSAGDEGMYSNIACSDMNKDGYDEVIFGVPCESSYFTCDGKAYVIFGTPTFPDTVDLDNPSIPVTCIHGVLWEDGFLGVALTTGDINNDTFEDLIISAPNTYPGGIVYAILGRDSFPSSIDLTNYNQDVIRIIDPDIFQGTAKGLACEDVDKDNFDDVFLGSPGSTETVYAGKGTVLFGAVDLPDTVLLSDESIRMIRIFPVYNNGQLGRRTAIGDVDGDQEWDLIISAPTAEPLGCDFCGEVYIIYNAANLPDSVYLNSSQISTTKLLGAGILITYGEELLCEDVTGDGLSDIMIKSEFNSSPPSVSKVTIVYGSTVLADTIFLASDTTVTRILGESAADDELGQGMAAGDFNDDGVFDLFVGAPRSNPLGRLSAGKIHLFWGIDTSTNVVILRSPALRLFQNHPNPFSSTTTINYQNPYPGAVVLKIYNVLGQEVARINRWMEARGLQSILWDGRDSRGRRVPSGIYIIKRNLRQIVS